MKQKPKISYLIALYNKEAYIEECVTSILKEACDDYELEICVVDDGSNDASLRLMMQSYSRNPMIKINSFDENRGKVAAYNKAFEISDGGYICIMGADDLVVPGRTQILLNECLKTGKAIYGSALKFSNRASDQISEVLEPPRRPRYLKNLLFNRFSGGCFLAPREIFSKVMPIPEFLKFEDWWIANKLLKDELVLVVSSPVTLYRIHGGNDIGSDEASLEVIRKDVMRHFDYLDSLLVGSSDYFEKSYVFRAIGLRNAICSRKVNYMTLLLPPFDFSWVKLFVYMIFGERVFSFREWVILFYKNLRCKVGSHRCK